MEKMKEFISKLEDLMPAKELMFESTPSFGYYRPFLEHAVAHPAKMNTKLLEFLIRKFTKPGDIVLDPMAGTASTGVVAALNGRNAICVELEEKFYRWMEKARENVEKTVTFTPKGWIKNICGDARYLSDLLSRVIQHRTEDCGKSEDIGDLPFVDSIITSPPYERSETIHKRQGQDAKYFDKIGGIRHFKKETFSNKNNIGNLEKKAYLDAMLKVYTEMWKVLKPDGLAIVVIKPFVRNKKVVDLPYHTWLLLKKVGFKLYKLYKLRLKQQSFWRILYEKKYPSTPKLRHEYVVVVKKHMCNRFLTKQVNRNHKSQK